MAYGAGGAILTRAGSSLVSGFVPGAFAGSPLIDPVLQAAVATFAVRPLVGRFLGKPQGEIAMLGGLISAGLSLADKYIPGIQNQLTSFVRAPVQIAPSGVTPVTGAGMGDVYDVDMQAAGFGALGSLRDVEDVTLEQFD